MKKTDSGASPQSPKVQPYWETVVQDFDSIYTGRKSAFQRWLDQVFRKDMYQRYEQGVAECRDDALRTVLDIGTGSGRFALALAAAGKQVTGIDFSPSMIELARAEAVRTGVAARCRFEVGDFLKVDLKEPFDAVLAVGLFDYIRQPSVFLEKMRQLCRVKLVVTFPVLWSWRVLLRWPRLQLKGCPVYFFSERRVRELLAAAGFGVSRLERLGHIWFVVARPAAGA